MSEMWQYSSSPYRFIGAYLARHGKLHLVILVMVTSAVTCSVATQYGIKYLVDALSDPARNVLVWTAVGLLAALITADNMFWRIASWTGHTAFVRVSGDIRRDLFRHLTGHSPGFFQNEAPGALTSRITATSNALYTVENMVTFNALPPLIATIVSIGFLAAVSVPMALALAAVASIVVVIMFKLAANGKTLHHGYANEAARVDGEMIDIVSNMPLVRSFGRIASEHTRFKGTVKRELCSRQRSLFYLEKIRIFHAATTVLMTFALLAWVISLWQAGRATAGDVILVTTLGVGILSATRDLAVAIVDVTQHLARLSEALRKLLVPHTIVEQSSAKQLHSPEGEIEFSGVSFIYPDGKKLFDDLSFNIKSGERVGLVGPSGGGKSSVFSLLQRFYSLQSGRITIDGQDIAEVVDVSLRGAIAIVPQDITLFHRSLRENIRYGRPAATDQEIHDAAVAARCETFIDALPEGLDTIVGDRGTKLSGGQRQRIAIARAFLKDAPILLLDEATSALDTSSEELIREALDRLMHGRTVIAIAHRLSTLRSFDRIMVVQDGRIVQDGSPDNLLQKTGAYKSLVDLEFRRLNSMREAA